MITVTLDAVELFLEVHHFLYFGFRMRNDVPRKLRVGLKTEKSIETSHLL